MNRMVAQRCKWLGVIGLCLLLPTHAWCKDIDLDIQADLIAMTVIDSLRCSTTS